MTLPPEARRLRADLSQLTNLALNDLGIAWRTLETADAAKAALNDILPRLILVYGAAAGALAADWYDSLRDASGAAGRFSAVAADLPADVGAEQLAGYAVGSLYRAEPDWGAARTLANGGLQRRIANASRKTLTTSSIQDPSSKGWQRVGFGECAFCSMLIGRGAVYSDVTADFASHDACECSAQPVFVGQPVPVKPFAPSGRNISDADRARVSAYLADN